MKRFLMVGVLSVLSGAYLSGMLPDHQSGSDDDNGAPKSRVTYNRTPPPSYVTPFEVDGREAKYRTQHIINSWGGREFMRQIVGDFQEPHVTLNRVTEFADLWERSTNESKTKIIVVSLVEEQNDENLIQWVFSDIVRSMYQAPKSRSHSDLTDLKRVCKMMTVELVELLPGHFISLGDTVIKAIRYYFQNREDQEVWQTADGCSSGNSDCGLTPPLGPQRSPQAAGLSVSESPRHQFLASTQVGSSSASEHDPKDDSIV